jgi:hypothetical protein
LTGSQGGAGAQGNQGSAGAQGNQGGAGGAGNQGLTGAQGNQGLIGNQGLAGAQGAQGAQGPSVSVFGPTGTLVTSTPHDVQGSTSLALVPGPNFVTLTGSAVFTDSTSYVCSVSDSTNPNAVQWSPINGTAFVLVGTPGDLVYYNCIGG